LIFCSPSFLFSVIRSFVTPPAGNETTHTEEEVGGEEGDEEVREEVEESRMEVVLEGGRCGGGYGGDEIGDFGIDSRDGVGEC
jgi:hypothetical protein